jgi:hypothetical protein
MRNSARHDAGEGCQGGFFTSTIIKIWDHARLQSEQLTLKHLRFRHMQSLELKLFLALLPEPIFLSSHWRMQSSLTRSLFVRVMQGFSTFPGSASLRSMNSPTGINSRTVIWGTHEIKVYFSQVKRCNK